MDFEMVNLQLDGTENRVLARVLRLRMEELSAQPASEERDAEMHVITSICVKASAESSRMVALGRSRLN